MTDSIAKIVLHPSAKSGDALPEIVAATGLVPVQSNRHRGKIILITPEAALMRAALTTLYSEEKRSGNN